MRYNDNILGKVRAIRHTFYGMHVRLGDSMRYPMLDCDKHGLNFFEAKNTYNHLHCIQGNISITFKEAIDFVTYHIFYSELTVI